MVVMNELAMMQTNPSEPAIFVCFVQWIHTKHGNTKRTMQLCKELVHSTCEDALTFVLVMGLMRMADTCTSGVLTH